MRYEHEKPSIMAIKKFITHIFNKLHLALETIVIMLIYIERLMTISNVEIRRENWKPIVFTGLLLASKFWEDLSFWNIDFTEVDDLYDLDAVNTLESEFLVLINYNLFVSPQMYASYFYPVKSIFENL